MTRGQPPGFPVVRDHLGKMVWFSSELSRRPTVKEKMVHQKPIGLWTLSSGAPVEIRDTITTNSDLFKDELFFDKQGHLDGEIVPHRVVLGKGVAAWGFFEVTNDVSKYTKTDVFNGVGKKTQALARLSVGAPGNGGTDLGRDLKDLAVKLYTKDGILDFLSIQTQQFAFKDPVDFTDFVHAFARRNPKTFLLDLNALWDIVILKPAALTSLFFLYSDPGIPNGWRHSDFFPIHTFELVNKHGERWYARFNWRTEQGREFLTTQQVQQIADPDYFVRDLYNSIANKTYPTWRLDMDVLSLHDIQTANFNPFELTRLWPNGTYQTVTVGRLVLNQHSDNQFRDAEQAAYNPSNLVPGIPGPIDQLFRGRRYAYRDTQNYRLGRNHQRIGVNSPKYVKNYNRDGHAPVNKNGKDAPIYYPNSFNGPLPLVNADRPKENLIILESNAVDLQEPADYYNERLPDDAARQRLADNLVLILQQSVEKIRVRAMKLLSLVSKDLTRRVVAGLQALNLNAGYEIKVVKAN
ncbi:catalase domain-containing protein [Phthorimaea operculella]|nr:catalase domain-containing protein [Phthorimaea operculella]